MEQNIQLKDSFGNKLFPKSKTEVVQEGGYSPSLVMSQKAVTDAIDLITKQCSLVFSNLKWTSGYRWIGSSSRAWSNDYPNSIGTLDLQETRLYRNGSQIRIYNDSDTTYNMWINWFAEGYNRDTAYKNAKTNEKRTLPAHSFVDFDIQPYAMFSFAFDDGSNISKYELNKIYIFKSLKERLEEISSGIHDVPQEDIEIRNDICKYRRGNVDSFMFDSTANTTLRFFHFSDIHGDAKELNYIIKLANKWHRDGALDLVINSGDTCLGNDQDDYTWFKNAIKQCDVDIFSTVGNHDSFGGTNDTNNKLAYSNVVAPTIAKCIGCVQPENAEANVMPCFYKDYGSIRVIALYTTYLKAEQLTWLKTVLTDAITNKKAVIAVNHTPFSGGPNGIGKIYWNSLADFLDDNPNSFTDPITWNWGQDTPIDVTFVTAIKEFIDNGGEFICWLSGHLHNDYFIDVKDHDKYGYQPTINITTARASYSNCIKIDGEYSRHNFNYVSIDTNNKMIAIMRIGCHYGNYHRRRHVLLYSYSAHKILQEY